MNMRQEYNIKSEILFDHQQLIDVPAVVAGITERWSNRTLTNVNDSVVRLAVIEGEFHWHKHDREDEFFFVLSGELLMDLPDRTVTLRPQQGITISKGMQHRPRAPQRTVILLVESRSIQPTGD